jgi:2-oxoglutarate ferredoxin oxidoreductase subunit alpha
LQAAEQVDNILVVEMNSGMMLEDVLKGAKGKANVEFYGRMGGVIPFPDEILSEIKRIMAEKTHSDAHPRDQWLSRMEGIA